MSMHQLSLPPLPTEEEMRHIPLIDIKLQVAEGEDKGNVHADCSDYLLDMVKNNKNDRQVVVTSLRQVANAIERQYEPFR